MPVTHSWNYNIQSIGSNWATMAHGTILPILHYRVHWTEAKKTNIDLDKYNFNRLMQPNEHTVN